MSEIIFTISPIAAADFTIVPTSVNITAGQSAPVSFTVNAMGVQGVQGVPGAVAALVYNEQPAGLINGSNNVFTTLSNFQPGKVSVFINGLLQKIVTHYQTTGTNTIILSDSLTVGDQIQINYIIL